MLSVTKTQAYNQHQWLLLPIMVSSCAIYFTRTQSIFNSFLMSCRLVMIIFMLIGCIDNQVVCRVLLSMVVVACLINPLLRGQHCAKAVVLMISKENVQLHLISIGSNCIISVVDLKLVAFDTFMRELSDQSPSSHFVKL